MKVRILVQAEGEVLAAEEEREVDEWEAAVLIAQGKARLAEPLTLADVRGLLIKEEKSAELLRLREDLIPTLRLSMLGLSREERGKLLNEALGLFETRAFKVLRSPETTDNMTPDELHLFYQVRRVLRNWLEEIRRRISHGAF